MSDIDVSIDDDLASSVMKNEMTQIEAVQVQSLRDTQSLGDAVASLLEDFKNFMTDVSAKKNTTPLRLVPKRRN